MLVDYSAKILVHVAFTDAELDILFKCGENHYDSAVAAQVKQGGCLYGARGVNDWWNKHPTENESDKARDYTFRELDKMAKSLEMYASNDDVSALYSKLYSILKTINEKTELVNQPLYLNNGYTKI